MANFTDTFIRNLKSQHKRFEEFEGGGFGIRVTPNGVKTWIYRYKIDGKTTKLTLGHYPTMSLANAKMKFIEYSELRRDGIDPKAALQQEEEQENNNVEKLVTSWYANYVEKHLKRPLTIKKQIDKDIIPLLGKEKLTDLQTRDITIALDKIVMRGAGVHANRVLSSLKQLFNYAVSRGYMSQNPANNICAKDIGGHEKPRERFLTVDEIKTLLQFLDGDRTQMASQTKIAIRIILLTGVRTAELRLAKWDDIDFEQSLWTIPAENSKASMVSKIHLSEPVKKLFRVLETISESQYVLTGADGSQPLTENALPRAIKRIQDRVGIPDWTAHDLRRTFATQLGETLQIDPVVIEKCLGHKMPRIMATYNRNEMLPQRRDALNQWAQLLDNLLKDNVLLFNNKNMTLHA